MNKALPRWAVCAFFAVFLALGLLTAADYGPSWDEQTEMDILRMNLWEYARVLGLDESRFETLAARQGPLSIETLRPISQSIEQDHGTAAFYPFGWVVLDLSLTGAQQSALWHMACWAVFTLGGFALYATLRQMGLSRGWALLGPVCLLLTPPFFAHGHFNNKDIALFSLALCALWQALALARRPGFARGVCFALCGALAANTKVAGLALWGLCAVVLVTAQRRWDRRMACVAAATVALFAGFYALLTPALWSGPVEYLRYLLVNASGFTRWPGVVLFRGMRFEHAVNPLPRYYLVWMMLVTLPLYVTPLAAVGQLSVLRRVWQQRAAALRDPVTLALTAASLCWFVPLLFAVLTRPLVYNGWRHFYFVYAGVVLLGARGLSACIGFLRRRTGEYGMHRVFAAGLCLFFAWTAGDIAKNHPYQYAYYNRLGHKNAETQMELDYWVVSTRNAMQRLLREPRDESLPLQIGARDDMSQLGLDRSFATLAAGEQAALEVVADPEAPYLFSNTTYAIIYEVDPPEGYHVLFTLDSYSIPICTVYERD